MPKGTKAAPPQQASLNELWKKGKTAPAKTASDEAEGKTKLQEAEARPKISNTVDEESALVWGC